MTSYVHRVSSTGWVRSRSSPAVCVTPFDRVYLHAHVSPHHLRVNTLLHQWVHTTLFGLPGPVLVGFTHIFARSFPVLAPLHLSSHLLVHTAPPRTRVHHAHRFGSDALHFTFTTTCRYRLLDPTHRSAGFASRLTVSRSPVPLVPVCVTHTARIPFTVPFSHFLVCLWVHVFSLHIHL